MSAHISTDGRAWRAWLSATCIVVAAILVPVAIVAAWARVQLVDEDAFVATLSPLAVDADVQAMVVDETMDALTAQVDFGAMASSVIDGVAALGLPPRAVAALRLLEEPAAEGLRSAAERAVTRAVGSEAFTDVWATATRAAHRGLVTAATSDGRGLVVRTDDGVGIQLGAVVAQIRQSLAARDAAVADLIPAVDRVVILGDGETLALLRGGYALAVSVGLWLPVLAAALLAAGVLIARRRTTALLGSGVALLVGAGAVCVGVAVGGSLVGSVATDAGVSAPGLDAVYVQLTDAMVRTAVVTAVLGTVLALLVWSRSRWRVPAVLRARRPASAADSVG